MPTTSAIGSAAAESASQATSQATSQSASHSIVIGTSERERASVSLARRIAQSALRCDVAAIEPSVIDKVRTCLFDCFAGALASRDLPWSRQAIDYALAMGDTGATLIGEARTASWSEAAFANASMAHGLVQEDMHTASVSHIGVVIIPALLALAERSRSKGEDFVAAMVVGYQVMARLGQAVVNRESALTYRPLGMTGAVGAAAAGARLLRLSEEQTMNAIVLAANTVAGFNEWPRSGGSEMFFHPGFAARNGLTCVLLAQAGARGAESALDGPGGMLAAFRTSNEARHQLEAIDAFAAPWEIMAVYHKPAPVCNFAQTPGQAALHLIKEHRFDAHDVRAITVRSFPQAIDYPGCAHRGSFSSVLQAKMSIPFAVASALVAGQLDETSYRDPAASAALPLAQLVRLEVDQAFSSAFPQQQGAEVIVELRDGRRLAKRLDALISLEPSEVRDRFHRVATATLGLQARNAIDQGIRDVVRCNDLSAFARALRAAG